MSYGFPMINFCIPVVHYETPCISVSSRDEPGALDLLPLCDSALMRRKEY